ncbi:phage virion morphogenesis protein [Thiocapsa roseopersicina]|uniref:Phage virion morphogenesis (Putative tail completion) protein n=1 Tax=Thiocapsa roseopersicina TaxID=1058 RepID=A0A1H3CNM2_THIRO|nr:phage virion morphogenesis protein [Thiocapsa roseopersicina]SDX55751.1 phage virion morphogenesis (putative tail completion) protein [Thiocapsa roseopersicina]
MAGARITIELDDDALRATLGRLAASIADPSPALAEIGEHLLETTRARFGQDEKRGPDGMPWARNTETTIARKGRDNPLHKSGTLAGQLRYQLDPRGRAVEVGSNRVYAAVQQFGQPQGASGTTKRGGPIPWGDIPPRPFLGVSADDREAISNILINYLAKKAL